MLYADYAFFGNLGTGEPSPLTTTQDANCAEVWIVHSQGSAGFGNATVFCSNISESQLFSTADSATVWRNWAGNIRVNNVSTGNFASPPTAKQTVSGEAGTVKISIGRTFRASAPQSGWFGAVQRVLCINRVLTSGERIELQAYLQIYHSF